MNAPWGLLLVLLSATALAGCIGGSQTLDTDRDDASEPMAGTGSIHGRVLTRDLNVITAANVALSDNDGLVKQTRTQDDGRYRLDNVEPGDYRLQVTAVCCREHVRNVQVVEGETLTVDLQLDLFTAKDLQRPYSDRYAWTGFLACGAGAVGVTTNPCALDPSSDNVHYFDVQQGIQGFSIGMSWDAAGGVFGERLYITMENRGCGPTECSYTYKSLEGDAPLHATINDEDITSANWKWDQVEGKRDLQFRVFPSFEPNIVYQQAFTVHWEVFYNQKAPANHNPVPDA